MSKQGVQFSVKGLPSISAGGPSVDDRRKQPVIGTPERVVVMSSGTEDLMVLNTNRILTMSGTAHLDGENGSHEAPVFLEFTSTTLGIGPRPIGIEAGSLRKEILGSIVGSPSLEGWFNRLDSALEAPDFEARKHGVVISGHEGSGRRQLANRIARYLGRPLFAPAISDIQGQNRDAFVLNEIARHPGQVVHLRGIVSDDPHSVNLLNDALWQNRERSPDQQVLFVVSYEQMRNRPSFNAWYRSNPFLQQRYLASASVDETNRPERLGEMLRARNGWNNQQRLVEIHLGPEVAEDVAVQLLRTHGRQPTTFGLGVRVPTAGLRLAHAAVDHAERRLLSASPEGGALEPAHFSDFSSSV